MTQNMSYRYDFETHKCLSHKHVSYFMDTPVLNKLKYMLVKEISFAKKNTENVPYNRP